MNKEVLSIDVQLFLHEHADQAPATVALKKSPFASVSSSELAEQVDSAQRLKSKLPHWLQASNIYFPPRQNAEQCSSEATASYKASLLQGKRMVDLTGGYGVDAWAFSQHFEEVEYCEVNDALYPIVKHNFKMLGCENVETHLGDGIHTLEGKYDLIYLDPARRDEHNRKMVSFSDCLPNVVKHQELLFHHSDKVMIKASPMMDISLALEELEGVKEIHIVAIKNECKELLFLLQKDYKDKAIVHTVNINGDMQQAFSFERDEEKNAIVALGQTSHYLYEPNAAVLKSGAFNLLVERFNVKKLHSSTHLYTSEALITSFPGKIYKISHDLEYNKKAIKRILPDKKVNIKTYNFPNSPQQVKKKLGLYDGGTAFLFGVKTMDEKYRILLAEAI